MMSMVICIAITATFRILYVFVIIEHASRRIVHVTVTAHPIADWTLQQLREAVRRRRRLVGSHGNGSGRPCLMILSSAVRPHGMWNSTHVSVGHQSAYAPELNVVDHAWGHTKYGEMAHFIPHDVDELAQEVAHSLIAKHGRPELLKAFFQHARLEL